MPPKRPQIESIDLVGDGLRDIDPTRLQMLEQMMAGLGLSVTVTYRADSGPHTSYPEHIPEGANFSDYGDFCREQGFSSTQVHNGWRAMVTTQGEDDISGR